MTDLAVEFKLLDGFIERHTAIPPNHVNISTLYSSGMMWAGKAVAGMVV